MAGTAWTERDIAIDVDHNEIEITDEEVLRVNDRLKAAFQILSDGNPL